MKRIPHRSVPTRIPAPITRVLLGLAAALALATINPGAAEADLLIDLTAEATESFEPQLRMNSEDGMGINSALPNSQDTTTNLDETPDGVTPERLIFTFSRSVVLKNVGLLFFDSRTDTGTSTTYFDVLEVTAGGTTVSINAGESNVAINQTVFEDTDVAVVTLPEPLFLAAGQTLSIGAGPDGDGDFTGEERSSFQLHSITIPEPGALSLLTVGAATLLGRRRA